MTGRSESRVAFCNKFDFVDKCLSVKDPHYEKKLKELMPVGGFKHIIDCVGVDNYDELISLGSSGVTIVVLGMHAMEAKFSTIPLFLKEGSVRTGLYFSWEDYKHAFELIKNNQDVFMSTITSVIPADAEDVQKAFEKLFTSGSNDECKIVIEHKD